MIKSLFSYVFAKNYRKRSLFEKVMAKIKRCSFFCLTVYITTTNTTINTVVVVVVVVVVAVVVLVLSEILFSSRY